MLNEGILDVKIKEVISRVEDILEDLRRKEEFSSLKWLELTGLNGVIEILSSSTFSQLKEEIEIGLLLLKGRIGRSPVGILGLKMLLESIFIGYSPHPPPFLTKLTKWLLILFSLYLPKPNISLRP